MTNVQEALKSAIEAFELHAKQYPHMVKGYCVDALENCKAALADIDKFEPVAYIHKHYLNDDKDSLDWHKREHPHFKMIPLCTTPQPIEKCEPVGEVDVDGFGMKEIRWKGYHWTHILSVGDKLYTSPISKQWISLTTQDRQAIIKASPHGLDRINATEAKLKQLNTEKV